MTILQIHNYYIKDGGEEVVVETEQKLLQQKGHEVITYTKDNHDLSTIGKIWTGLSLHWSSKSATEFESFLAQYYKKIDVIHVHNLFPQITPSIFGVAEKYRIPFVYILHNYRLIHPNGLLYHAGNIDERSLKGSAYNCVKDGVYRNSMLLTALLARSIEYSRKKRIWDRYFTKFIVPTDFAKKKLEEGGLPENKMVVKPHFVFDPAKPNKIKKEKQFLFLGRLVEEKGLKTVLKAWDLTDTRDYELIIVGSGPLEMELKFEQYNGIRCIGKLDNNDVYEYLYKSKVLIFSSEWYETFGLTIIEAFSSGTPIICSDIEAHSELVTHNLNGLKYTVGDAESLSNAICEFINMSNSLKKDMRLYARKEYLSKYTPEINYNMLMDIYSSAIDEANL